MGTIVYSNLVELLLDERDKSKEEIIEEAIKRFGFPDENKLIFEVGMQLIIGKDYFKKLGNGKYHMVEYPEGITNRESFLELLNRVSDENYFEQRPHIKKLKEALEKRWLHNGKNKKT